MGTLVPVLKLQRLIRLPMGSRAPFGACKLKVPPNTLLNLPSYSPELNPVENLWHWSGATA